MTFLETETSKDKGEPYELYEFAYGPNEADTYRYCKTVGKPPAPAPQTFEPISIQRDAYKTSGKAERDTMNIKVPINSPIAQMILPYPPPYEVQVTIWAGHFNAGPPMVIWSGRILSNAFDSEGTVVLTCESTLVSLRRMGVRRRWQIGCPLTLYGSGTGQCNAEREDFKVEVEVLSVDENGNPVFAAGWEGPFEQNQFKTGIIKWQSQYGTEYRTIRAVQPDRIVFNGQIRGMEPGEIVTMYLGCNHKRADCEDVFDNIRNYGGDDWMPLTNPVRHPNFW